MHLEKTCVEYWIKYKNIGIEVKIHVLGLFQEIPQDFSFFLEILAKVTKVRIFYEFQGRWTACMHANDLKQEYSTKDFTYGGTVVVSTCGEFSLSLSFLEKQEENK